MGAIFPQSHSTHSLLVAGLLSLAACTPVPLPFKGADQNWEIIGSITARANVAVAPIEGLPAPLNQQIADRVAEAARQRDVAVTSIGFSQAHGWLRGKAAADPNGKEIEIEWTMSDAEGVLLDQFSTTTPIFAPTANDPWLRFANSDYAPAVGTIASRMSAVFETGASPPLPALTETTNNAGAASTAADASQPPYRVHISAITGAPGDGSVSLKEALGTILTDPRLIVPITLANAPSASSYLIDAQINLRPKTPETQSIRLNWRLLSPSGEVLGNVAQQNDIPTGSLNGPWNEIAFFAAEAAAEGLVNLLMLLEPVPNSTQATP